MEKYALFFDIDGTLLDEKTFTIPLSTKKAIQLAKENGHDLFINTGRPISTIDQLIKDLNLDGYVCGCGTYIEYKERQIFHTQLDEKIRKQIIDMIYECQVDCVLEGKHGAFFQSNLKNPFLKQFKQRYIEEGFRVVEYQRDDIVDFDKFALWFDEKSQIDLFKKTFESQFEFIRRDVDFYEIVPLGYSKATGIQFIQEYLGLDNDHVISFGDSTNDLSMLNYTKHSVAMGNSNPLLFDQVSYITTDINDDGIYNALKHFKII